VSRQDAKAPGRKNSKHEIRNPKQYQMTQIRKFKTGFPRFGWISQIWDSSVPEFVLDFAIRISNLVLAGAARADVVP
jgi:hypothetical protein